MFIAILMKTIQHEQMRISLLQTGQTLIVEDTAISDDTSWGCGREGKGLNLLGKVLMAIRAGLIDENIGIIANSREDVCDVHDTIQRCADNQTIIDENIGTDATSREDVCDVDDTIQRCADSQTIVDDAMECCADSQTIDMINSENDVGDVYQQIQFWLEEARHAKGLIERPSYLPTKEKEEEFLAQTVDC
eukprot:TRINITY_DN2012_c0_g2_i2.p4 TRINITY_DN2012_c0_g2~~TRINITY_DN2012_c0_g2_i2.p4  ORF type:complete len:191 (-),score=29.56 TRINITY_DN2012_c0_g2_i2:295-867(-)